MEAFHLVLAGRARPLLLLLHHGYQTIQTTKMMPWWWRLASKVRNIEAVHD